MKHGNNFLFVQGPDPEGPEAAPEGSLPAQGEEVPRPLPGGGVPPKKEGGDIYP